MDLPILGADGPSGSNGGGALAAIDRTYAVSLYTADGDMHTLTMRFGRPTDASGVVDFAGLKGFNPQTQAMARVAELITAAQLGILMNQGDKIPPVIMPVEASEDGRPGSRAIVWRHVVSFEYLGEWDPTLKQLVMYTESHEHLAAA